MIDVKKNFFYSSILTSANYIFTLITYPYVSRVLGVTNIGICNFIDSIINYYIMFSMMGIVAIGIREVAANKENRVKLSKIYSNLFCLNSISTGIAIAILLISIFSIPKLYTYKSLMFIGLFKVIFNYLLISWLYRGLEDFKYITKYGLLTKIFYVLSVFILVRKDTDYNIYYLLSMLMLASNAIINLLHSKKFVSLSVTKINFKPYISSFLILGTYLLLTSMYTTFNVAYLGFICGETEVGYYTTATKLHSIFLALFTTFTGVMLPRMSALISEKNTKEFRNLLSKSLHILFIFSIPIIIFSFVFAPQIILIIAGANYELAITPMRIVMPLIIIIGYEQIVILQALMPLKKDKDIFINSVCGAATGILLNILIVGHLKSVGSAIVWFVSELVILILSQIRIKKYINAVFPVKTLIVHLLYGIPCLIICHIISRSSNNTLAVLTSGALVTLLYYYILYVKILKEEFVINTINQIKEKIIQKNDKH